MGIALIATGVAVGITVRQPSPEPVTLTISEVPEFNRSAPTIHLSDDDVARFPHPAAQAWEEAATNGTATFSLPRADAERMTTVIKELAARDDVNGTYAYLFHDRIYEMASLTT